MKKFTFLNIILTVIFVLFISMPSFAFAEGSRYRYGGNHDDDSITVGDIQLGVQLGKNNTAINGDNSGKIDNRVITKNKTHIHNKTITKGNANNSGIIIQGNVVKGKGSGGEGGEGGEGGGGGHSISASIDNSVTTIEADKREHHTGTPVSFASLGTYSESKYAGANFQSAKILTMFKDEFSYEGALEVYGAPFGKGKCETVGKSYNGRHEDNPTKNIKVFTMDDKIVPGTIKSIGFLTVKARKGKGATSFVVLQKCVLSTAIMQGDAFLVTKEGAETITKTSGWGIGFNTSGSMINDMENRGRSAAASGGTGYSSGTGSLEVLPWMTVQVLKFQ